MCLPVMYCAVRMVSFKSLHECENDMCLHLEIIMFISTPQELFNRTQISETLFSLFYKTLGAAGCSSLYFYSSF